MQTVGIKMPHLPCKANAAETVDALECHGAPNLSNVYDPVPELHRLLGSNTVFMAWRKGTKGENRLWGHLKVSHMTERYLANLKFHNIGVKLGEDSNNLVVVDMDEEPALDEFVKSNPHLLGTLQIFGARGRSFWFRMIGPYPVSTRNINKDDRKVGEFRAKGGQSIIYGVHPDGPEYRFVVKSPVLEIKYSTIVWPDGMYLGSKKPTTRTGQQCCSGEGQGNPVTNERFFVPHDIQGYRKQIDSIETAVSMFIPTQAHMNNSALFGLARALLTLQNANGRRYDWKEINAIFDLWYSKVEEKGLLRRGKDKLHYHGKFENAIKYAKTPIADKFNMDLVVQKAKSRPFPECADMFIDERAKLLVAICAVLQEVHGEKPFFLSGRKAAELVGVSSNRTISSWFGYMEKMGVIKKLPREGFYGAGRFLFKG